METILQQETPQEGHRLLSVFVGEWHTKGQTIADSRHPSTNINGIDTYKWLEGGFFLIHYVDVRIGEEKVNAIEIIGYDPSRNIYPSHSFDNKGSMGNYEATVQNGVWTLTGKTERATIVVNGSKNELNIKWEKLSGETDWLEWMNLQLTKK